jgi:hypothetical protein
MIVQAECRVSRSRKQGSSNSHVGVSTATGYGLPVYLYVYSLRIWKFREAPFAIDSTLGEMTAPQLSARRSFAPRLGHPKAQLGRA